MEIRVIEKLPDLVRLSRLRHHGGNSVALVYMLRDALIASQPLVSHYLQPNGVGVKNEHRASPRPNGCPQFLRQGVYQDVQL